LRRKELTACIALGAIVALAALLAVRLDLASLLLPDVPASATIQRASAPQRASAAGGAAPFDRRPVDASAAEPSSSTFDVVRIDPEGSSVFAGRAPANSSVTVMANQKPVASAKANSDGQWAAVIDRQFTPGEYQLSLTAKSDEAATPLSGQSVNITIASNARPAPAEVKVAAPLPPAPITFPYDEADITAVARKNAAALVEFVRQRRLDAVTLSGHADDRGSDDYNMALSRHRLESVARYLRASGYAGKLVLVPKGRSEPSVSPDRDKLSKEAAFQLDRRVELRVGR
jgi:outer membrane protein OmpA-like peptidoglycan-associated protein